MGGGDSARIHPGEEAGSWLPEKVWLGHRYAALGPGKRQSGSRKNAFTKKRVGMGPICLSFLFTCIFNDPTHRSFVVFSDF